MSCYILSKEYTLLLVPPIKSSHNNANQWPTKSAEIKKYKQDFKIRQTDALKSVLPKASECASGCPRRPSAPFALSVPSLR